MATAKAQHGKSPHVQYDHYNTDLCEEMLGNLKEGDWITDETRQHTRRSRRNTYYMFSERRLT
jgi:molybdopterin/thiamine biosynthesis adenylyltransferase